MHPSEWQQFFDSHAAVYLENGFTRDTKREVDFVLEVLALEPGSSIIDVGCGVGRHTLEIARRGYAVTGADLSPGMLDRARRVAAAEGLSATWVQTDAMRSLPPGPFDAAICLCEGAFCLLSAGDDPFEHDLAILRNASASLARGGRLLLSALNGMRFLRAATEEDVAAGRFDPITMTEQHEMEFDTPQGRRAVPVRERGYVATELRLLVQNAGFEVQALWGGTAGRFARRPPELDEMELMILGRKR